MQYSLLYISQVVNPDNTEQLNDIREQSIDLNQAHGLTGLLLSSREYFCQILQGQKTLVEETMSRIARDTRHRNPIVLLRTDLAEALFPTWSMATSLVDDTVMASQIARAYHDRLADLSVVDGIVGLMQQFQLNNQYKTPIVYSRTGLDQQLATLSASHSSDKTIEQVLQLGCTLFDGCALILILLNYDRKNHYIKSSAGIDPTVANSMVDILLLEQSNNIKNEATEPNPALHKTAVNLKLPGDTGYQSAAGCDICTIVASLPSLADAKQYNPANKQPGTPTSSTIGSLWVLSDSAVSTDFFPENNVSLFRLAMCVEGLIEQKLQSHANELLKQRSRRQQLSLAASNRRQEMVMNVASSAIIALDRDLRVLIINDTARRLFGDIREPVPFHWPEAIKLLDPWSLEPVQDATCPIRLAANNNGIHHTANEEPDAEPAGLRPIHSIAKWKADSTPQLPGDQAIETSPGIFALQMTDAEPLRYLRVASSLMNDPESAMSGVVVFDDVTELQHNRERIRNDRLEALGHLTGGIAHDFNNLLSTVQNSVELATTELNDKKRLSFLEVALDSVRRGADLTDKLVAFAAARPVSAQAHCLIDVLKSVSELVTASIEQDINFVIEDLPDSLAVYCDGGQLENALLNILINSRDAILESGIGDSVSLAVKSTLRDKHSSKTHTNTSSTDQSHKDNSILITVTDNGPGMSAEVLRRATDPFFTTRVGAAGSGLGLSMVYRFVEQSGGELVIENLSDIYPGRTGVRVSLLLEQTMVQPIEPTIELSSDSGSVSYGRSTVLLVEDETSLAEMLQQSLSRLGLDTRVTHSADNALKILHADSTIDLLLTDIVMPGSDLDGYRLAAEAIRLNPNIKVVYISGYPQQSGKSPTITYGPLVKKPVSINQLVTVIRTELGQQLTEHSDRQQQLTPGKPTPSMKC